MIINPKLIASQNYSTSEKKIGIWVDNKPLYRKTISVGALPNGEKTINHGISNLKRVVNMYGCAYRSSDGSNIPLMNSTYNNLASSIYVKSTTLTIVTFSDRTAFKEAYVTLEYTKTTD